MKVEFTSPLWCDDWESEGCWILLQDLTATVTNDDGTKVDLLAPAAFVTDFCTVPRMPLIYDIFGNIARKAGALHDRLYFEAKYPREWCDQVLRAAVFIQVYSTLIAQGVPSAEATEKANSKAEDMYIAVRILGGPHYGTKTLKLKPYAP